MLSVKPKLFAADEIIQQRQDSGEQEMLEHLGEDVYKRQFVL